MGYLNIIATICLLGFMIYTKYLVKQNPDRQRYFLKIQLFIVLLYNIGIIIIFPQKIPVEFSTIAYFIVPIIMLFDIKEFEIWAVYASLLAGIGYYVSMILYGTALYGDFPTYSWTTSIYNHGALLSFSIVKLRTTTYSRQESYIIWIGLSIIAIWSLTLRPVVTQPGRIFIYEILDGKIVSSFFPNMQIIMYPIYYILLVFGLYKSPFILLKLNEKLKKIKST
jgi:hypothetical protein